LCLYDRPETGAFLLVSPTETAAYSTAPAHQCREAPIVKGKPTKSPENTGKIAILDRFDTKKAPQVRLAGLADDCRLAG
jgi:hypothetical protein